MKKQVYKGKELTRTKVRNNILNVWNMTSENERFDWYQDANKYAERISEANNCSKSVAVGVIAALSPVKKWSDNMKQAEIMLKTGSSGHMKQFVLKAKNIMSSNGSDEQILSILHGQKISSFYLNIKYFDKFEHITIDRHALSIALGHKCTDKEYSGMTPKQYEFFVQCYITTAMKIGVNPLLLQSATWVKYRSKGYQTGQYEIQF